MSKSKVHKERIIGQKEEIIQDIVSEMVSNNAEEISLKKAIVYSQIDEFTNEVIRKITLNKRVSIGWEQINYNVSMQDLSTEQLNCILEELENKRFDVEELIEEN